MFSIDVLQTIADDIFVLESGVEGVLQVDELVLTVFEVAKGLADGAVVEEDGE